MAASETKTPLRSLTDVREAAFAREAELQESRKPHANGIACPECGLELWDSSPGLVLTSNPPQRNVHCPACKWRGYAFF